MGMLISLTVITIWQQIHISKYHIVHLKYKQFLFTKKEDCRTLWNRKVSEARVYWGWTLGRRKTCWATCQRKGDGNSVRGQIDRARQSGERAQAHTQEGRSRCHQQNNLSQRTHAGALHLHPALRVTHCVFKSQEDGRGGMILDQEVVQGFLAQQAASWSWQKEQHLWLSGSTACFWSHSWELSPESVFQPCQWVCELSTALNKSFCASTSYRGF